MCYSEGSLFLHVALEEQIKNFSEMLIMYNPYRKTLRLFILGLLVFFSAIMSFKYVSLKDSTATIDRYLVNCLSLVHLKYARNDASIEFSIKLDLDFNGEIAFAGRVIAPEGREYRVSRIIYINYSQPTSRALEFHYKKTQKSVVDSLSDDLFDILLYDTKKDSIKLFIERYRNGYIISNYFSPMTMCINEDFAKS